MKRKVLFSAMLVMAVLLFSAVGVFAEGIEMTLTPEETWYYSNYKGSSVSNPNYQAYNAGDIISYTEGNYLTLMRNRESYAYVKFDLEGITESNLKSAVISVHYDAIKLSSAIKIESITESAYNVAFPLTGTKTLPPAETTAVYTSKTLSTATTAGIITTDDISEYIKTKILEEQSSVCFRISFNDGGNGANNGFQFNGVTLDVTTQTVYIGTGTSGGIDWSLDEKGTLNISGEVSMPNYGSANDVPWASYRSSIKKVVIEDGVTAIGKYAFSRCSNIEETSIPDSVTTIGNYAFYYCTALKKISIPKNVTTIGNYAFGYCDGLSDVYYDGSKTQWSGISLGLNNVPLINATMHFAEEEETSTFTVTFVDYDGSVIKTEVLEPGNNATAPENPVREGYTFIGWDKNFDNITADLVVVAQYQLITTVASGTCGENLTWILVNEGTLTISGTGAMYRYDYLNTPWYANNHLVKRIVIENGVTEIGNWSFYNCDATNVVIPDSVTIIGETAFASCSKLTSVTIPEGVTTLEDSVFSNCLGLESITVPESVTTIERRAFNRCEDLSDVYYAGSSSQWYDINIDEESNQYILNVATIHFAKQDAEIITHTVTFVDFDGTVLKTETVEEGKKATAPEDPTREGHTFTGWDVSFLRVVSDLTVTAQYNVNIYEVAFADYEGNVINRQYLTWGQSAIAPEAPERQGYTFIGWDVDFSNVTSNLTVTAQYELNYVASGECGESLIWTLDKDGTLTISGVGEIYDCSESNAPWYEYASLIKTVVIESGVTSIGNYAFAYCENLTSITIPDSVTNIGNYAFYSCTRLTSITIPGSVTSIGEGAFYTCAGLTSITIPDSVTSIGDGAFDGCSSLTSVTIPDSVTSIGDWAFYDCDSLTEVYYGGTEEQWNQISIGSDNEYLINATIHYTEPIYTVTFVDHDGSVLSTQTVEEGNPATAPENPTREGYTFTGWDIDFSNVTSDLTVTAQYEWNYIASGECGENLIWTLDKNGTLIISGSGDMYDFSDGTPWIMRKESIKSVSIEEGVTYICEWAFSDCRNLEKLTIPGTVTKIGSCAFTDCTALESVTIPYGVETIGSVAFNACTSLKEVIISNSVKTIENEAFSWCTALVNLTIPESVTTIGEAAFDSCTSLTSVTVSENNKNYSSQDGVLFDKDKTIIICYPRCKSGSYEIPNSVTSIGSNIFYDCDSLTSVSIPGGVTNIGNMAFYSCDSLTDVHFGGTEEQWNKIEIGEDNEPLTSATIHFTEEDNTFAEALTWELSEDGVLTISGNGEMPDYVYAYDSPWYSRVSEIKKVIISKGVTKIGNYCFDLHANIESVVIADSVTVIGNHAFSFCSGLTEINIPDGVTVIDEYTFDNCKALETITIGNGVTTIKELAFSNCSALTTVTIPKTVTEIKNYAFYYTIAITDVYYTGTETEWEAITIGSNNNSLTDATLHFAEEEILVADPDIVTGSDGFNRYYIDGEIQTKWQVTPSGYKYYFSTSAAKYGAATIGKNIKIGGVYYDFDTDGRVIESYDEEGNPVHYCNPEEGTIYTVTYDAQGGTSSVASKRRRVSTSADLSVTAEKENCKFLGWGLTKYATEPITSYNVTKDVTLYAIYEQVYVVMCEDGYYRYYVDGTARTGWQVTPDGYKYYFSGLSSKYGAAMVGKNQKIGGSYYDFAEDGKLIDGYDESGNPIYHKYYSGFVTDNLGNTKYYVGNKYVIGWQYIDGYKYYFSKSTGNMLTGYTRVGSVYYNFNQDGTWNGYFQKPLTGEECLHSDLLTEEYGKYRYYVDGEAYKGWKVLKGDTGYYKYYFSKADGRAMTSYGIMVGSEYFDFSPTGTFISVTRDENGNAVMEDYILSFEQGAKNGIILDEDGKYRYYIDGEYQTGWHKVNGYDYLLKKADGSAITTVNYKYGAFYYDFTEDGKFLEKKTSADTRYNITMLPGEGTNGEAYIVRVHEYGEFELPENTFVKEGYEFIGWTDGIDTYQPGKIILVNCNREFTAVWEYIPKNFVFTFTYLEESITISAKEGESVALPENTFVKAGYEFDGWTDGKNTYLSGSSITATGNMSFTPLWKCIPKDVTLTFTDKDAEPYVITVKEGHTMRLGDGIFEREDCRFIGWLDDIYIYLPGDIITVNEDMVLTAVWQKVTEVRTPITAEFIQPANIGTKYQSVLTGEKPYISVFDEDNDYDCTKYYLNPEAHIVINGYDAGLISENESTYYGGLTSATDLGLIYSPNQGEVVLVDKNGDGKYDIIEVTAYETAIVDEVYAHNTKIATKFSGSIVLTYAIDGEKGYSYELTKGGQPISVSDLKEYDVLSVAVSPDKKNYKILVSDTKVEGTVVSCYKPSALPVDQYVWMINDTEYKISNFTGRDTGYAHLVKNIIPGDEGTAYLDAFGKIAYFEKAPLISADEYSFIMGAGPYTSMGKTHYEVQFLNADGSVATYDLADSVDVMVGSDELYDVTKDVVWVTYLAPKALYDMNLMSVYWTLNTNSTYYDMSGNIVYTSNSSDISPLTDIYANRIVSYETDENGKISSIIFPAASAYGDPEEGLFKYQTLSSSYPTSEYNAVNSVFYNNIGVTNETVVFNLPISASSTEDDFRVCKKDVLEDSKYYDVSFLQVDPDTADSGLIVLTNGEPLPEEEETVVYEGYGFISAAEPYTSIGKTNYEVQFLNADGSIETYDLADTVDVTVGSNVTYGVIKDAVWATYLAPKALYVGSTMHWAFNTATTYANIGGTTVYTAAATDISPLTDNYADRIVTYNANSNGKITAITFNVASAYGDPDEGLFKYATLSRDSVMSQFNSESNKFANDIGVTAETVVFSLPISASSTEDDTEVSSVAALVDGKNYDVAFLQVDHDTGVAGVIILTNTAVGGGVPLAVITKVMTVKNAEGYDVVQFTFLQNGEEKTYNTTNDIFSTTLAKTTKGTLMEYSLNANGEIDGVGFNAGPALFGVPAAGYVATFGAAASSYVVTEGYAEGFVTGKDASRRLQIKSVADVNNDSVAAYRHSLDGANFYMIDLAKKNITPEIAAFGDIQTTYIDADGKISDTDRDTYVLIKYVKGEASDVVVYKGFAKANNILQ